MFWILGMFWVPIVDTILPLSVYGDSVKEQPKAGMSGIINSDNFVKLLQYCC